MEDFMNTGSKVFSFTLRRLVSLKPYGDALLTPMAAAWTTMMTALVFIMASSEAISWAYFASFFFNDWRRFLSAVVTGVIVFSVVWCVDVSLLTLDRAKGYYEQRLYGSDSEGAWKEFTKTGSGILVRLMIVGGSLYFTSPYLTQLIFTRDINKELERQTKTQIADARKVIESNYDKSIESLQQSLDKLGTELTDEIAGRTTSRTKKYGDGPVAGAIRDQSNDKQVSLKDVVNGKNEELTAFDKAVSEHNTEELGNRWNVVLPENSITKRSEALDKITGLPMFWQTSLAIKGFLAFLFFSMLVLKIFEPRGVRIYLSEAMQQEWQRYKAGAFDIWLAHHERANAPICTMTTYRFDDVMVNSYLSVRNADLARIQSSTTEREAKEGIETLKDIEKDMPEVVQELTTVHQELATVEGEISKIGTQQGTFPATITHHEDEVDRLEYDLTEIHSLINSQSNAPVTDIQTLKTTSEAALRITAQLSSERAKLNQLQAQKALCDVQLIPLYEKRKQLSARADELQAKLDKIDDAREEIMNRRIASATNMGVGRVA
jgi:hypothetical protein